MNNNIKVQKYSIRKYSVGAASILIGTLLFLNPSNAEAQELEPNSSETKTKEQEGLSQANNVTNPVEIKAQEENKVQTTDEQQDSEVVTSEKK